jgi:hypothetical protein
MSLPATPQNGQIPNVTIPDEGCQLGRNHKKVDFLKGNLPPNSGHYLVEGLSNLAA